MLTTEATNNDPWGPHGTQMAELAKATGRSDDRRQIMGVLWKRVAEEKPELWRHVYKALAVFDYLIANGDMAVVDELRDRVSTLKDLSSFQYKDAEGKDQVSAQHAAPGNFPCASWLNTLPARCRALTYGTRATCWCR